MFRKILVALDLDETCVPLFNKALALAQATEAELLLLSVLSPNGDGTLPLLSYPGMTGYPLTMDETVWSVYQQRYQEYKEKGLSALSRFTDQATAAGVQARFTQVTGNPGWTICDRARTQQADLIVVGSHGRRGLSEMLIGSVSNYVTHHAPCSVLVVHADSASKATAKAGDRADARSDISMSA
ncbi:MAG: universal stress protein [Phormidesmis sp.]